MRQIFRQRRISLCLTNLERGFTLVEVLVSIIVLVTVGSVSFSLLSSSLQGANKARVINNVRQNGSYAIIQMSKAISYAKNFEGVSLDGVNYAKNCVVSLPPSPTPTPTPIPYKYVKITSFDGGQTVFACLSSPVATIAWNGATFLDTASISLDSCSFTCMQENIADFPIVGIHFTLSQKNVKEFADTKVSVPFGTSITIRNPKR